MDCDNARKRDIRCDPIKGERKRLLGRLNEKRLRRTPIGWCKRGVLSARWRALQAGIAFTITWEDVFAVYPADGICPALGIAFQLGDRSPYNPSIDRINPKFGYISGNIAVISRRANAIKQDATFEELERIALWLKGKIDRDVASGKVILARGLAVAGLKPVEGSTTIGEHRASRQAGPLKQEVHATHC
jgi:hypothetical protein